PAEKILSAVLFPVTGRRKVAAIAKLRARAISIVETTGGIRVHGMTLVPVAPEGLARLPIAIFGVRQRIGNPAREAVQRVALQEDVQPSRVPAERVLVTRAD